MTRQRILETYSGDSDKESSRLRKARAAVRKLIVKFQDQQTILDNKPVKTKGDNDLGARWRAGKAFGRSYFLNWG